MRSSLAIVAALALACSEDPTPDAGPADAAAADATPQDGGIEGPALLWRYALDGNTDEATNPARNGAGTGVSPAADRKGRASGALRFDGATSVVTISGIDLSPPYSVSLWFEREGHGPGDPGCIAGEIAAVVFAGYRFLIDVEPDQGHLAYALAHEPPPPQLDKYLGAATATTGWHHVVLVDEVDRGSLWLDGQRVRTSTLPNTRRKANFLTLGGHPTFPCGLQGRLDEVQVYTGVLDAPRIDALYRE